MKKFILVCLVTVMSLVTLLLIAILVSRLQMEYNDQGIYFDEKTSTTYNSQALIFFKLATLIAVVSTTAFIFWLRKLRKIGNAQ